MERFIIFLLCTGSISWIIVRSRIFKSLRETISQNFALFEKGEFAYGLFFYLNHVFNCVGCCGVYSAFVTYLLLYQEFSIEMIAYVLAGSIISLTLNKFT